MENLNIAELLKDCPKGMELDCAMYDSVQLNCVLEGNSYPIKIETPEGQISLNKNGCYSNNKHAKCVIFPKGKTTWEGFVPPCKFKDGDIVATNSELQVFILQRAESNTKGYCYIGYDFEFNEFFDADVWEFERLATEEEKQKLFDAIKENGYHWNAETKTLEKLPKLPKFKVGDKIEKCGYRFTIKEVREYYYLTKCGNKIPIDNQDDFSLVPNKFDITTLKAFDKVLVRDSDKKYWSINFFGFYNEITEQFHCVGNTEIGWDECIPYEVNKELLGTTNNPKEYGSE